MNRILSYNPFGFRLLSFVTPKMTDNSRGADSNYFGRLRRGSGTLTTLSGKVLHIEAGELFYIPIGLRYRSDWRPDESGRLEWESYPFPAFPAAEHRQYTLQTFKVSKEAEELLSRIEGMDVSSAAAIGCFFLFMSEALSVMVEQDPNPAELTLERARAYISAHPDFKVSELARACNMSESGLFSLFQKQGLTPIELKHRILIEKAVTLLSSTDLSVTEISDRLGFSDPGYFRKILRRITGKTPKEVRREHQERLSL